MTNFMFPSLKEFREWLELNGSKYVGKTRTSCNCPYHNFLVDRGLIQVEDVVLQSTTTLFPSSDRRIVALDNPESVSEFIHRLDGYYTDSTMVTGKFCVGLLDSLGLEE